MELQKEIYDEKHMFRKESKKSWDENEDAIRLDSQFSDDESVDSDAFQSRISVLEEERLSSEKFPEKLLPVLSELANCYKETTDYETAIKIYEDYDEEYNNIDEEKFKPDLLLHANTLSQWADAHFILKTIEDKNKLDEDKKKVRRSQQSDIR